MEKIVFLSALFFVFTACNNSAGKSDNEIYKDDIDVESAETENEYDFENDSLSDFDEYIELCGPDLTKKVWESEAWKKGDDDKDGIPNGYECSECPCRDSDGDETPDYIDRDSDNDNLSDFNEKKHGTDPYKKDTDGDGDDDATEIICNKTDPLDAEDYSTVPTICSSGCYQGNDVKRELSFNTVPKEQTDITFLIDATSSMGDYLENVKLEITELINEKLSQINEATEDFSYGLIELPYNVILPQTKDAEIFKTKVSEHSCEESWELHLETIYQSLIGNGFKSKLGFSGLPVQFEDIDFPEKDCEGELGDIGGACLRENANHVLIILSDMEIIEIELNTGNNDTGSFVWQQGYPAGSDVDDVILAAVSNDAKFVKISPFSAPNDLEYSLLVATGSQTDSGEVLYFGSLNPENGKLSDDIVAAIKSLLEYEETDLKMELILPDSSETFDKYRVDCKMNVSFKTLRAEPEEGIEKMDETTFYGVKKGTKITYEISFDDIDCYDVDWYEDHPVKTYYLYPQLKSGDKVVATEIIQVKVFPVTCE